LNHTSILNYAGFSRLKLYMALSRTAHGVLDMATPALGAMLWLGSLPPFRVIFLGVLTAFAGYTAVYALNDVVDYRADTDKIKRCGLPECKGDLDALCVRHPLAQGLLSLREGVLWTVAWGAVALVGAYALNPVCALIFIAGCVAEGFYCMMLKVSYLRTIVSGGVKTAGGLAAVYAVVPDPSPAFVTMLFLWLFSWEIGGQNIPNDWSDVNEDGNLDAETIPVRFGSDLSSKIILGSLVWAVILSLGLFWLTPAKIDSTYLAGALLVGVVLLLMPAARLYRTKEVRHAAALFNKASYYPVAMLTVILVSSMI
jgi:4-hydroxybenzoate polyprenyltransferase